LRVSSDKSEYYSSDNVTVEVEAIRQIGDQILHVANVSINGSLRNASKSLISNFNCTTGENGRCLITLTAPSTNGDYILELNDFKAIGSFSVIPFSANIYMKDELGKSLKNIFAQGTQARVEVSVQNASSSNVYTFSGYIKDSSENVIKLINSTQLNVNNSFTNTFLFTVDSMTFDYGAYTAYVTVQKTGTSGNISLSTSFEVKDWSLYVNKKSSGSGFEYGYSIFPNQTMRFETYPTFRSNGTVIPSINASLFTINLKDNLDNVVSRSNVTWNATCGSAGCYEFLINSSGNIGTYYLETTLSYEGVTQTNTQIINVIDTIMSAQSTNKDGDLKELFGTDEYVYISLSAYNSTASNINLTDAEIFIVEFMNGSEFSYTKVNNFSVVNSSNSVYEWAWNSSLQRIKLDVPKVGGLYNAYVFGNNKTVGTTVKFIVNPYDICTVSKDTPGNVSSGYYYVWQFKTTDTIYFELRLTQADNPLGKAPPMNITGNNSVGTGAQCNIDTSTKQAINNATITVVEVKNADSGALQSLNTTDSTCEADDNDGGYTCTVKPLSRWEGGSNLVKFNIEGQDGTTSTIYNRFEARAFYLYGSSQTWQNSPTSNITLNVQMYEAGNGYWSRGTGLSGTVTLKKIEYQGRDGEWISPPIDYNYNVSNVSSTTVTSSSGTMSIPASNIPDGKWKTGYYRAVLQGTTSSGDTDYGYAWFGVKLWDVYAQPIDCSGSSCQYKSYFNSKKNISLFVKISQAGDYSYSYSGGQDIGGNVTIGIKKIEDCRTWPCKELNASKYNASTIIVNESSPWYWNANLSDEGKYIIYINTTTEYWGTGYYSVVLDVNGTDTGYGWYNTIAFYVSTRPTDSNGSTYKYNIKPPEPMYFNVTTTKDYKSYYGTYDSSDYINVTVDDLVLKTWNQTSGQPIEYNYPEDINITPHSINGTDTVNITFNAGSWPTGYFYGELYLKNSENETSTGRLWFDVRPFRVQIDKISNYNLDEDQCMNSTIYVYEPDWNSNSLVYGNYSIISVYENIYNNFGMSITTYTNYTNSSFNATDYILFCPNDGEWPSGSWGGYHSLNVIVRDNVDNSTQVGWLSFRTNPFQISWGNIVGGNNVLTSSDITIPVSITKYSSGENVTGNLSSVYQWRYDNYMSTKQEYVFSVGNCYSNVSGQCSVNGTQNITLYAPNGGWKSGYNYLYTEWKKPNDANSLIEDWGGIYFNGKEPYNGYYSNSDVNGLWKYYFNSSENITIKLYVRNSTYDAINVNVTDIQYAFSGDNCWDESCRTYTSASSWSLVGGSTEVGNDGNAILNIQFPSINWSRGYYYIKTTVSGNGGTSTIPGGYVYVKDMVSPNVTISSPTINQSITGANFSVNITTNEDANCYITMLNYDSFYSWYCANWNGTNNSANGTLSPILVNACNITKYDFNGSTYHYQYLSKTYYSVSSGSNYDYWWQSGTTGLVTDAKVHGFVFNTTNQATGNNLTSQDYGIVVSCYDEDWNYGTGYSVIGVNVSY